MRKWCTSCQSYDRGDGCDCDYERELEEKIAEKEAVIAELRDRIEAEVYTNKELHRQIDRWKDALVKIVDAKTKIIEDRDEARRLAEYYCQAANEANDALLEHNIDMVYSELPLVDYLPWKKE